MTTYKQIQDRIRKNYGYTVKTCWIAHLKEICGLDLRNTPNRYDENIRTNPCPPGKIERLNKHSNTLE